MVYSYCYVYVLLLLCMFCSVNEMGGACGAYGAGERGVQGSGGET